MKINIIIIGAYNYCNHPNIDIDILNNYKRWNNSLQGRHQDLEHLIRKLQHKNYRKIRIICLDPMYPFSRSDNNIHYLNRPFLLGDTDYLSKSGHNIIIEFANLLDEYFVTKDNMQSDCMQLYNNYKVSIVSCGCSWDKNLPIELIISLVEQNIYTPTDSSDKHSYTYARDFNELHKEVIYQPFCQGLYQTLGSLMWRGCKENDYKYESVLLNLFNTEDISAYPAEIRKDLQRFLDRELQWNNLGRPTRSYLNELIYGTNIIIT